MKPSMQEPAVKAPAPQAGAATTAPTGETFLTKQSSDQWRSTKLVGTTVVGPHLIGRVRWSLPDDLWGTLIAADRLVHLNLAGLYTQPTGLVTFPGAAVILAPVATLIDAAGLSLQHPGPHNPQPAVWLVDPGTGAVALKTVVVARYETDRAIVSGGLSKGDIVVTAGVNRLHENQKVQLVQGGQQ